MSVLSAPLSLEHPSSSTSSETSASPVRQDRPSHLRRFLPGAGVTLVLGLIVAWLVLSTALRSTQLLPYPWELVSQIAGDASLLWTNGQVTLSTAFQGLLLGVGAVIPLAAIGLLVRPTESVIMRVAVFVHVIPTVAVAPILVVSLSNEMGRVVITALQVYYPALVGLLFGLRQADRRALDVIHVAGGGVWQQLLRVRLAAAAPSFISVLQVAVPAAVLGSLISEFFGAHKGLGVVLVNAQQSFEIDRTWAIAVVVGAAAALGYGIVTLLGRWLVPWASSEASVGADVAGADTRRQSTMVSIVTTLVTLVILLGGWQSLRSVFGFEEYFTKSPSDVWQMITSGNPMSGAGAGEFWSQFGTGLRQTLLDAAVGFVIGSLIAVAAAVVLDAFPRVRTAVMPLAVVLRSVPVAALIPLMVILFGRGLVGVTIIVTLVTFFPTLVTVLQGLQSTPDNAVDVVRASGGGLWQSVVRVKVIYAVPSMLAAARVAVPGALAGATLAEWLSTGDGLGYMLTLAATNADYLLLWTAGILLAVVALALTGAVGLIDRVITRRLGA
jgi:ABC-type nitrate/sulfonate/bicarbonate transport system permease component